MDYGAEDYADYLARKYGGEQELGGSERSYATTSVAPRLAPSRPPPRPATASARPTARQLSRNRAAKRASTDVTVYNHLSTMYHMNRRIYEMYNKAGLLQEEGEATQSGGSQRPATSAGMPGVAGSNRAPLPNSRGHGGMAASRPATAPIIAYARQAGVAVRLQHAQQRPGAAAAGAAPLVGHPEPASAATAAAAPSYVKRHVANTAAALKAAILDEIVAHRVYESQRLNALFRSYLKLNAGEAFFPTLAVVVEELKAELGV